MMVLVHGPFWTSEFELVELASDGNDPGLRALFAQYCSASGETLEAPRATTAFAIGYAKSVIIDLKTRQFQWTRSPGLEVPEIHDERGLREALIDGRVNLLTVAIPLDEEENKTPEWRCLGGEIPINEALRPRSVQAGQSDSERFFSTLGVSKPSHDRAVPDQTSNGFEPHADFTLNASGVFLWAATKLPWTGVAGPDITCPMLLTYKVFGPGFELRLDDQRLDDSTLQAIQIGWTAISRLIVDTPNARDRPDSTSWMSLEISGTEHLPTLAWQISPSFKKSSLLLRSTRQTYFTMLIADQPRSGSIPAESLAKIRLDRLEIRDEGAKTVVIVHAGEQKRHDSSVLTYQARWEDVSAELATNESSDRKFVESFSAAGIDCVVDPIETSRLLRNTNGLSQPSWSHGDTLAEPIVWAFSPLADGWIQLPFPNLTEQIYLDAELDQAKPQTASQVHPSNRDDPLFSDEFKMRGAAQFGNATRLQHDQDCAEHPWTITLTGCDEIRCRWSLVDTGNGYQLDSVESEILEPRLTINGLFWLSTQATTPADAIPNFDGLADGLQQVTIESHVPGEQKYPSLVHFKDLWFEFAADSLLPSVNGVSAKLGQWSFEYSLDDEQLGKASPLGIDSSTFNQQRPWVWLRHPTLPMIQSMPLTQRHGADGAVSASRQLFPFELGFNGNQRGWLIGTSEGAKNWPSLIVKSPSGKFENSKIWNQERLLTVPDAIAAKAMDLQLLALTVPGVVFLPNKDPNSKPLSLNYRYDLPALDQVNAFAEVAGKKDAETAQDGQESRAALERKSFAEYWYQLGEQSGLATADGVFAFKNQNLAQLLNLVQPYSTAVTSEFDAEYPGRLSIRELNTDLTADLALRGICADFDGTFDPVAPDAVHQFRVTAGSMVAAQVDGGIRDQRGLTRYATSAKGDTLQTRLTMETAGPSYEEITLTSLKEPALLHIGAKPWGYFWFKDLPMGSGTDQDTPRVRFVRPNDGDHDVNDPNALSQEKNHLLGYEWRLQPSVRNEREIEYLDLHGLHFYPLTLEEATLDSHGLEQFSIVGRLQLPLANQSEIQEFGNATRISFRRAPNGDFDLATVAAVEESADDGGRVWPISDEKEEFSGGSRIVWRDISLSDDRKYLNVQGTFQFLLFNAPWSVPIKLQFGAFETDISWSYEFEQEPVDSNNVLIPVELSLSLQRTDTGQPHTSKAVLKTKLVWGPLDESCLTTNIDFDLLQDVYPTIRSADSYQAFDIVRTSDSDLKPEVVLNHANEVYSLQFDWVSKAKSNETHSFLPGIRIGMTGDPKETDKHAEEQKIAGFATMTFRANEVTAADGDRGMPTIPDLVIESGFVEILMPCHWQRSHEAALSNGDLLVAMTSCWTRGVGWKSTYSITGNMKCQNLISWPEQGHNAQDLPDTLTLPAATDDRKQIHHSIEVMFNQHEFGSSDLIPNTHPHVIFQLNQPLSLPVVLLHRVEGLDDSRNPQSMRWTSVQNVSFFTPMQYASLRRKFKGNPFMLRLEDRDVTAIGDALSDPHISEAVQQHLVDAEQECTLIIEASAHHWVHRNALDPQTMSTAQMMPGGSQMVTTSEPAFFSRRGTDTADWIMLQMPFISSLSANDHLATTNPFLSQPASLLSDNRDPSGKLVAMMCGRNPGKHPQKVKVSPLDSISARTFEVLDSNSLEENWYRMNHPANNGQELHGLAGITQTVNNAPASLSRASAVRAALAASRKLWIDGDAAGLNLLKNPGFEGGKFSEHPPLIGKLPDEWVVFRFDNHFDHVSQGGSSHSDLPTINLSSEGVHGANALTILSRSNATTVELGQRVAVEPGEYEFAISVFPIGQSSSSKPLSDQSQDASRVTQFVGDQVRPTLDAREVPFNQWTRLRFSLSISDDETNAGVRLEGRKQGGGIGWKIGSPRLVRVGNLPDSKRSEELSNEQAVAASPVDQAVFDFCPREDHAGWHISGQQIRELLGSNAGPSLHAATTLLAAAPSIHDRMSEMPVVFSICPYIDFAYVQGELKKESDAQETVNILLAELICLNGIGTAVQSVGSRLVDTYVVEDLDIAVENWAQNLHRRICPDSPILVIRYRSIRRQDRSGNVSLQYRFNASTKARCHQPLSKRVNSLRSRVDSLKFREGQFGGFSVPKRIREFELAPPFTSGVQPVYLEQRPSIRLEKNETDRRPPWPWGWSGMRVAARYTQNKLAILGPRWGQDIESDNHFVWWQSLHQVTQFKTTSASGLPTRYRSNAIKSLLPVCPSAPLPDSSQIASVDWQPTLPGQLTLLLIGSRPGVFSAMRCQLTRQQVAASDTGIDLSRSHLVSGSVPIQHRMPRPVSLPPNVQSDVALRTWGESNHPLNSVRVDQSPRLVAEFVQADMLNSQAIAFTMVYPPDGVATPQWDGRIELQPDPIDKAAWPEPLEVIRMTVAGTVFTRQRTSDSESDASECLRFEPLNQQDRTAVLHTMTQSGRINAKLTVRGPLTEPPRELAFPIHYVRKQAHAAPIRHYFARFEDPEYNRKLASIPAAAEGVLITEIDGNLVTSPVTMNADRKEYNPDSEISIRWDWRTPPPKVVPANRIKVEVVEPNGLKEELFDDQGSPFRLDRSGTLFAISGDNLFGKKDGEVTHKCLKDGDLILISLELGPTDKPLTQLVMQLRIVGTPVIARPDAAYALLRSEKLGAKPVITCARFAWSPMPTRVEIVDPEDLKNGLVRRRAVFLWRDSAHAGVASSFALQKISKNGATHVPKYPDDFCEVCAKWHRNETSFGSV